MNLKIFTTALLATGAIAGRQGSKNEMPHEKQQRVAVRLFLKSRSMTSVSGLGCDERSPFCDFGCHTLVRALTKL